MRSSRFVPASALALALAFSGLLASTGCDGGGDGEQGSPIKPDEAASQAQAYRNFAKTKKQGRMPAAAVKAEAEAAAKAEAGDAPKAEAQP